SRGRASTHILTQDFNPGEKNHDQIQSSSGTVHIKHGDLTTRIHCDKDKWLPFTHINVLKIAKNIK
nr:hypothetical protein [Saprospiraceae bacterium]